MLSPCFAGRSPIVCWKGPVPSHMFYLGYIVCLLLPVLWEELCRFINAWHWNLTSKHCQVLMKSVGMSWYLVASVQAAVEVSLKLCATHAHDCHCCETAPLFLVQFLGLGLFSLFADMLLNLKLYTHIVRSAFNSVQVEYIIIMEKLWILMKKCMLGLWNTKWMLTILLVCFSPLQILLSLCRERQVTLIGILAQMEQLHLIQLMPT